MVRQCRTNAHVTLGTLSLSWQHHGPLSASKKASRCLMPTDNNSLMSIRGRQKTPETHSEQHRQAARAIGIWIVLDV